MSFRTQRLANSFPLWTKVRKDPSSVGQRLLSTFAEMSQEATITAKRLSLDVHLLKPYLGIGYLHQIFLSDDDAFRKTNPATGFGGWEYPNVVGTLGADTYSLTKYDDVISLLNGSTDRIALKETQSYSDSLVWTSASPFVINDLPRPERLAVEVTDSTFYSRPSRVSDREYSGRHMVQILGTDENDIVIREYLEILDDGVYWTKNIFKTVTEVVTEGFDGTIEMSWFPVQLGYEPDPYRAAVFDDFEGQLRLSLTTQVVGITTYSYVMYSSSRFKLGEEYRRPGVEATSNLEELAEVVLLDSSGNPYTAVDLAINHQTSKMYVLDSQGSVHVYDHELPSFDAFQTDDLETVNSYMELVPLRHRAKYGDTEYVYTDHRRLRDNVVKIEIKRIAPDGTIRYLQADRSTWGAASAEILANNVGARLPEDSWQDFRFSTEYDQIGQWEYVISLTTGRDVTKFVTAVQAGSIQAEASLSTGVVSPDGLGFSKEGYLGVSDGSEVNYYEEFVDGWIADTRTNKILMRSSYDQVEVSY